MSLPDYEQSKKIYKDLPHFVKIAFWAIAIIVLIVGYIDHRQACKENKQDEFLWCLKCYPKPDTVILPIPHIVYRDTCIQNDKSTSRDKGTATTNTAIQNGDNSKQDNKFQ